MALDSYLFEKACYVPEGLAWVAEDLRLLPAGSPVSRELNAYLNVALRHGLISCCAVAGGEFDGGWVVDISREGGGAWKRSVKPALEEAIFGPDERDERIKASGLPTRSWAGCRAPRGPGLGADPASREVPGRAPRSHGDHT